MNIIILALFLVLLLLVLGLAAKVIMTVATLSLKGVSFISDKVAGRR